MVNNIMVCCRAKEGWYKYTMMDDWDIKKVRE